MRDKLALILHQTEESYKNVHPGTIEKAAGWEKWYTQWLLMLSDIRDLLGVVPTPQTLEKLLLKGDEKFKRTPTTKLWSDFVSDEIKEIVARYSKNKQT